MSENNMPGDYLRACRELVPPDRVGLPASGVRRVAGLRHEPRRETAPASVRRLLGVLGLPAFAEGRYFDVLAANQPLTAPLLEVALVVFLGPVER